MSELSILVSLQLERKTVVDNLSLSGTISTAFHACPPSSQVLNPIWTLPLLPENHLFYLTEKLVLFRVIFLHPEALPAELLDLWWLFSQRNVCPSCLKVKFSVRGIFISSVCTRTLLYHLCFLLIIHSFIIIPLFYIRKCMEFKQCCGTCMNHQPPCSSTFWFPFTLCSSCSASIRLPSLYSQMPRASSSMTLYSHSTSIVHPV